eukprot:jgi/Botrbrau1/203/Bobra.0022s0183.1
MTRGSAAAAFPGQAPPLGAHAPHGSAPRPAAARSIADPRLLDRPPGGAAEAPRQSSAEAPQPSRLPAAVPPHLRGPAGSIVPAAGPGPEPPWRGRLSKSGVVLCDIICLDGIGSEPGPAAREPSGWPAVLDVQMRADISGVLTTVFPNCPAGLRAVRRLVLAPTSNAARHSDQRHKFVSFLNYLSSRSRAGIIQGLPPTDPAAGKRSLYLIPPTTTTAQRLGVVWDPAECLLALVIPERYIRAQH